MGNYYELIASLPHLPRFDKAEVLPISRERLLNRLKMLEPEDYKKVDQAAQFLAWRRQPTGRTNAQVVEIYRSALKIFSTPLLKELFEFPVNQRTILAALRRKEMGLLKPEKKELWGVGKLVAPIERNWDDPLFKLGALYPWIAQAKTYLQNGESLKLEYLLMNLVWDRLDRLLFKNNFGFEVIVAYLMKWDMIQQWLTYKQEAAIGRFEELIAEVVEEYEQRVKAANSRGSRKSY
jgi:hypothetical protein